VSSQRLEFRLIHRLIHRVGSRGAATPQRADLNLMMNWSGVKIGAEMPMAHPLQSRAVPVTVEIAVTVLEPCHQAVDFDPGLRSFP
jgi:hypothetical protein